ncbi:hypothetical protein MP228_004750 [Amoeboaphelidium protococcarum]|nr:hypothetical protein MP228_004750 [Amoeboaphelidium protococcarum]
MLLARSRLLFWGDATQVLNHSRLMSIKKTTDTQYEKDIYGYRVSRDFRMPDYSMEEQLNRNNNANLFRLVYAYRSYGHLAADLDPLGIQKQSRVPELDPARYGLDKPGVTYNLSGIVHIGKKDDPSLPKERASIEQIVKHLDKTYCGKIAYEFRHIPNIAERRWFANMIESFDKRRFTSNEKRRILELLIKSEVFDQFMTKKFPQVKRYGLEGAESMMIALDNLFKSSSQNSVKEVVVCMPHRGRLNLLTDLFQYDPTAIFHKIKGHSEFPEELKVSGDVLSHLFKSVQLQYGQSDKRKLKVTMLPNPSHLEAVNPVAMGKARAKQMYMLDTNSEGLECTLGDRVMCIQLHGDSAFTGQGVVMETLGLSNLPHFSIGGSIHVVVNNQIGYTTPAINSRSSIYASDVGKMINAPVIHVNGDHAEEVAYAASLALEYRMKFRRDVILDVITYRRWGHNELDEPAFTQPLMYQKIRGRQSVPETYEQRLIKEEVVKDTDVKAFRDQYFDKLDKHLEAANTYQPKSEHLKGRWDGMQHPVETISVIDSGVDLDVLKSVGEASVKVPAGMTIHPRLEKFHVNSRLKSIESGSGIDWATAEALAFGSLLKQGINVRISGQDVGRGTFSQRHAMLVDQNTEKTIIPLNEIEGLKAKLEVANSSLSEFAVLGFEYGYSLESPKNLNIWEAQFGDFFNGAQVIFDTYISSGEQKWLRQSGLVILLPHGYDGAGPEHSTCRMERFLQCSDDQYLHDSDQHPGNINWHVINPTTPAQYFHALRRQIVRPFRKPLVVVGPKTLLKSPQAVSNLSDMAPQTSWQPVLNDRADGGFEGVERVVFVSGKLYYDLVKERASRSLDEKVSLVRMEELCPFPAEHIQKVVSQYPNANQFIYCQEEPRNMGAFDFVGPRLVKALHGKQVKYVGRKPYAACATGISTVYKKEQAAVIKGAFE